MKNDEKFCPLCNMTCKGEKCGLWIYGVCAFVALASKAEYKANELYYIRKELEDR